MKPWIDLTLQKKRFFFNIVLIYIFCMSGPAIFVRPKPCDSSGFRLFEESPSCFHNGCNTHNAHQHALLSPHPRRSSLFDCCLFCDNAYSGVLKRQNKSSDFVVAFECLGSNRGPLEQWVGSLSNPSFTMVWIVMPLVIHSETEHFFS